MKLAELDEKLREEESSLGFQSDAFIKCRKAIQARLFCFALVAHLRNESLTKRKRGGEPGKC